MKPPEVPLEKIAALAPACLRVTVPDAWKDDNGHMNMRWYLAIFDDAGDVMHDWLGLTRDFHRRRGTGTFDLEHHIHYLSEVMPGQTLAIYLRYVAYSAKRLQYLLFMVNETTGKLASIFECMNAFADLKVRKTAPWPEEIAEKIAEGAAAGEKLDWPAPVSGSMRV